MSQSCDIDGAGGIDVLLGVHESGIDIEVRVDLDGGDVQQKLVHSAQNMQFLRVHIFKPIVLSNRPVEEATTRPSEQKARKVASFFILEAYRLCLFPRR